MPHLSTRSLDTRTEKQIKSTFEKVLSSMNNSEVDSFFYSILSNTERLMLAKRLAIVMLLKQGLDDVAIAEALCVTRVTVSRMNLALQLRPEGFKIAEEKINKDKLLNDAKQALLRLARYSIKAAGGRV